jgi:hypothetical protein
MTVTITADGGIGLARDMRVRWAFEEAGDLLMVSVMLRLNGSGILDEYPSLSAYVARGEARPAYKRAFDAQLAVFSSPHRPAVKGPLWPARSGHGSLLLNCGS